MKKKVVIAHFMSKDISKMIPCNNSLVFDRISSKTCCVDLWNYCFVIRSGELLMLPKVLTLKFLMSL